MDRVLHYYLALAEGFETTTCPDPRRDRALPDRGAPAPADRRRRACGRSSRRASRRRWRGCRTSAATPRARRSPPALQRVRLRDAGAAVPADLDAAVGARRRRAVRRPARAARARPAGDGRRRRRAHPRATCSSSSTRSGSTCARATRCRRADAPAASAHPTARALGSVGRPLAGRRAPARRRRRGAPARRRAHGRLPRPARGHPRGDRRRRLAAHRRRRHAGARRRARRSSTARRRSSSPPAARTSRPRASSPSSRPPSPLIAHACAVGDRRPYLTALLVLDAPRRAPSGRGAATAAELARDPRVRAAVEAADRHRQRPPRPRRADQALHAARRRVATGRRRAHAHPEAPPPRGAEPLRRRGRGHVQLSGSAAGLPIPGSPGAPPDTHGGITPW